jgi:hypothetical protein
MRRCQQGFGLGHSNPVSIHHSEHNNPGSTHHSEDNSARSHTLYQHSGRMSTPHPQHPNLICLILSVHAGQLAANIKRFENADIVAANERVVLTEPVDATCPANRTLQGAAIQQAAAALR